MDSNLSEASSELKPENARDDPLKLFRHYYPVMGTPIQRPEAKQIGQRLRDFRFGLADFLETPTLKTLRIFAEKTGVPENNLTAWELGRASVPPWYIQRLKDQFGVSFLFDWIYGGDLSGLAGRLAEIIQVHRKPKVVAPIDARHEKRRKAVRG